MIHPLRLHSVVLYHLTRLFTWIGLPRFFDREYGRIASGARVLTVGAGGPINKILLRHARSNRFSVTSIDIDHSRGPEVVGDLCACPFRSGVFDAVVLGEVLEHVYAPHLAIENLYRVLAPGGSLILTTPFIFPLHEKPRDYFRFTRYGLEWLLRDFREVKITARSNWAETINAMGVRLALEPDLRARLVGMFALLAAVICFPLAWIIGRVVPVEFLTIGYTVTARK